MACFRVRALVRPRSVREPPSQTPFEGSASACASDSLRRHSFTMAERETMAFINYYANQGFKRQIQTICADTLNKRGEDPVFRFWKAWSHDAEGNPNEALREYALAEGKREIAFALNTAMLHSHKRCKLIDQEAVDTLEAKLAVDDKNATEQVCTATTSGPRLLSTSSPWVSNVVVRNPHPPLLVVVSTSPPGVFVMTAYRALIRPSGEDVMGKSCILHAPPGRGMPAVVRMPACHSRRFKGERPIGAATG